MAKQTVIYIPEERMEELREYHKKRYSHISFSKMFVHITIEDMLKYEKEADNK